MNKIKQSKKIKPPRCDNIMASECEDDLNVVEDGDDADKFGDESLQDDIVDEDESNIEDECDGALLTGEEEDDGHNSIEAIAERHFADMFLESLGGTEKVLAGNVMDKDLDSLRDHSVNGWSEPVFPDVYEFLQKSHGPVREENIYPDLRKEHFGPTPEAMRCGDSPLPVALWQHIALCCNNYKHEQLEARAESYVKRRTKMAHRRPYDSIPMRLRGNIQMALMAVNPILLHELCVYFELLLAQAIQLNREKISNHCKQSDESAIGRGVFGNFMARDRFFENLRNFPLLEQPGSPRQTQQGLELISKGSFDKAMLSSRSSFNTTRVYIKDKP
ncbi:hypothetical protein PHMEG_00033466, partial [Phytophthora megakarya]